MTLLELHNKYQQSGINGNPPMSDAELLEYQSKLTEMAEFFCKVNPIFFSLANRIEHIETILFERTRP